MAWSEDNVSESVLLWASGLNSVLYLLSRVANPFERDFYKFYSIRIFKSKLDVVWDETTTNVILGIHYRGICGTVPTTSS